MSAEPLQPPAPPTSPLAGKTVRGAMQLGLFSCPPDTGLRELARMMVERSIHCVVVRGLRDAPHAYGIVSDLDLLAGLEDPQARVASDVVAADVVSVRPDNTLDTAAQLMTGLGTAHLIVLSPDTGFPVGMISSLDIARAASA
jgi:CBS domain-containing protein